MLWVVFHRAVNSVTPSITQPQILKNGAARFSRFEVIHLAGSSSAAIAYK
jgi:hypothetical protein